MLISTSSLEYGHDNHLAAQQKINHLLLRIAMMQNLAPRSSHRKWHTKSRTGCQTCRSRKIKCDERRPSCLHCLKKGLQCDFIQVAASPSNAPSSETLNLELLHHFTISTAPTLSHDTQIREVWRVIVPQMGFTTDYVLDGILALTALHVARYSEARRAVLLPYAIERHSQSLSRALPLVPAITPQNSAPLFIFGMLTLYFNLARPIEDSPEQGSSVIPEWLYLLHGIDTVVMAEGSAVRSSPVSLIFRTTWGSLEYWQSHTPEKYESLEELRERIREETSNDMEKQTTLCDAINALSRSYSFLYGQKFPDPDQLRGFWQWLFEIKEPYLNLVKGGDNAALCVLAFYAVLLKVLEKYWWMEGRAVNLLKGIYMMLDGGHRMWIRWAIEEVGWIPEAI